MAEAAFETAREIKLVAEFELRGDFFDREFALVEKGSGAIDARIEVEAAGGEADGIAKFFAKRLVGKAEFTRDGGGRCAGFAVGDHHLAGGVEPVFARGGCFLRGLAVGEDFGEHGNETADGDLRRSFLAEMERWDELKKAAKPVVAVLRVMHGRARVEQLRVAEEIEGGALELKPEFVPKFAGLRAATVRVIGEVEDEIALADFRPRRVRVGVEAVAVHHVAKRIAVERALRIRRHADAEAALVYAAKANGAERGFDRAEEEPGFYGVIDDVGHGTGGESGRPENTWFIPAGPFFR